jgi:hypothetical protein
MGTARGAFFGEISGPWQPIAGFAWDSIGQASETAFLFDFTLH